MCYCLLFSKTRLLREKVIASSNTTKIHQLDYAEYKIEVVNHPSFSCEFHKKQNLFLDYVLSNAN